MLTIKTFTVNPLEENMYVVSDEAKHAVIIDCGAIYPDEHEAIKQYISNAGLTPVAHLLTHAHFDHIWGVSFIYNTYGLAPRLHAADLALYSNLDNQLKLFALPATHSHLPPAGPCLTPGGEASAGDEVTNGEITTGLEGHPLRVIHTPGHTPGGVCFYFEKDKVLFSGDSLFRMSIGRTDLPGGDYPTLITSLTNLISFLPDDTDIYPGHGPMTTASLERRGNPYLK